MSDDGAGDGKDRTVAKTAGFVVFSGIAMSILKALNPLNKPPILPNTTAATTTTTTTETKPISESTQKIQHHHQSVSAQEPIIKNPISAVEKKLPESSTRSIEIVKGDTLWGLSRKYGVSIEAIKKANGLTGDTIYAGKKLIIP